MNQMDVVLDARVDFMKDLEIEPYPSSLQYMFIYGIMI